MSVRMNVANPLSLRRGGWSLGNLSPNIWTKATNGITLSATQGTIPSALGTWTEVGAHPTASGADFVLTAVAGNTEHHVAVAASNIVAGPEEITVEASAGTAGYLYIACGTTAKAFFDLATGALGTGSGTRYLDHTMVALGGGRYRCALKCTHTAAATERIGLSTADNVTTWNAVGTETITVRAVPSFGLSGATVVTQRRVAAWADIRGNGKVWAQTTAGAQPLYWIDARGPCVTFAGAQWMADDTLAAAMSGSNVPAWGAFAVDSMTGTTARVLNCYGKSTSANGDYRTDVPLTAVVAARCYRSIDGGTNKSVPTVAVAPLARGALVDSFDGTNRTIRFGGVPESSADASIVGSATGVDRATLGALRRNVAPSTFFVGAIRELALAQAASLSASDRGLAHAHLTGIYGY
jgi:hypothetical protein